MLASIGLGEILWSLLVIFVMLNVLVITVVVIVDLIRSHDLSGAQKALWAVAFVVFPVITTVVYLFARGDGIGERNLARQGRPTEPPPGYAPAAPATELQKAADLHQAGKLDDQEYESLKRRVLDG